MPSNLRFSMSPLTAEATIASKPTSPSPAKKQKMSLTQTYYLAHTARAKLSKEAARADHELRLLVGHANLLDGLMMDLADAEREQQSWFNQTVKGATKASEEPKHIQWADTIPEEAVDETYEEDWEAEASDNESDSSDDEDEYIPATAPRQIPQQMTTITTMELDEDDMDEDEDYEEDLALTRTSSAHPPELLHESDSESDDDSMPPSPPQAEIPLDAFSQKQRQAIATTSFYQSLPINPASIPASLPESEQSSFFDEGFYLPPRQDTAMAC